MNTLLLPPLHPSDPTEPRLDFTARAVTTTVSLANWMRGLALFYYAVVGVLALVTVGLLLQYSAVWAVVAAVVVLAAVLLGAVASWTSAAGHAFERGVLSEELAPIVEGFRCLRNAMAVLGICGTIAAGRQVLGLMEVL